MQPTIETERLRLRPFEAADAADVRRLVSSVRVASTTLNIPHPYPEGAAEEWISGHAPGYEHGTLACFALCTRSDGRLLGAIGLSIQPAHAKAELGYWIGVEYWGQGFATEAARAILTFTFGELALNRVFASHMMRNPASGSVLRKIGMRQEGLLRQEVRKWGNYEDIAVYGILASEWPATDP